VTSREQLARRAEALQRRLGLDYDHILGMRFAVNVFIATTIVWFVLRVLGDSNPIWAIASMIAASDPQPDEARRMFKTRLINVAVGCASGLAFLLLGARTDWMIPVALAVTVLISTHFVRIKTQWRQGPITAAIVVAAAVSSQSTLSGLQKGLHKVGEVVFGCVVGLLVSWFMSRLWLVRPPGEEPSAP
jgi:uncharacterized membrane protein YccC